MFNILISENNFNLRFKNIFFMKSEIEKNINILSFYKYIRFEFYDFYINYTIVLII